jgi:hypothetical protein
MMFLRFSGNVCLGDFRHSIRTDPFLVQNSSQVLEKGVELGVVSIDYNSVND